MGGDTNFKIPHYSQYTIKGIRELEWVQSELAARGLKDPWIRCGSCSIDKKMIGLCNIAHAIFYED